MSAKYSGAANAAKSHFLDNNCLSKVVYEGPSANSPLLTMTLPQASANCSPPYED